MIVEEFEEKVIEYHNKAADDEAGFQRVAKASQKAAMRKNKQKIKGKLSYNLSRGFLKCSASDIFSMLSEEEILCSRMYLQFQQKGEFFQACYHSFFPSLSI